MARPFQIALEDAVIEENDQPELVTVSDVIEETAVAEEEAEENMDIDEQVDALEEASEEADAMLDQSEVNEAKIEEGEQAADDAGGDESAADDAISEDDVVTSEENLKYSITRLGCDDDLPRNLRLSMEARAANRSRLSRLKLAQEGVADFIAKVISTIKTLIKKIINSCKKLFAKILFAFGRYDKKAKAIQTRINDLISECQGGYIKSDIDGKEVVSEVVDIVKKFYKRVPMIGLIYNKGGAGFKTVLGEIEGISLLNNVNEYMKKYEQATEKYIQELVNDKAGEKVDKKEKFKFFKEFISKFRSSADKTKSFVSKYTEIGQEPADLKDALVLGIVKDTVYYVPSTIEGKVIKTFKPMKSIATVIGDKVAGGLEAAPSVVNFVKSIDIEATLKNMMKELSSITADDIANVIKKIGSEAREAINAYTKVTSPKAVFKNFDDTESTYLKFVDSLDKKYGNSKDSARNRRLKIGLDVLRVGASDFNLFCVRSYIDGVKTMFYSADAVLSIAETIVANCVTSSATKSEKQDKDNKDK